MLGVRLLVVAWVALLIGAPCTAQSRYDAERAARVSPAIAAGRASQVEVPPTPRQFTVGDVSTPERRERFQVYVARACGLRFFRVATREVPSSLERGMAVGPSSPPYGQSVGCGRGVSVAVSAGPPTYGGQPPSYGGRTPRDEVPPILDTPYTPPPERPLLVDSFRNLNRIERFEARVAAKCGRGFSVTRLQRTSTQPPGQYDGQDPAADTVYACDMPVTVWTAAPRAEPDLLVGDLSSNGGRMLAQQVARKCDQELQIDNQERHNPADPGAFVSQSPAPETVYRCGMGVTIVRSLGPLPPPVTPDPPKPPKVDETPKPPTVNATPTPREDPVATTNETPAEVPARPGPERPPVQSPPPVPSLVGGNVDRVTEWSGKVAAACGGNPPGITMTTVPSSEPAGKVLTQSIGAGGAFGCGDTLTVGIAGAAPTREPPSTNWWPYIAAALALAAAGGALWWWLPVPRLVFGVPKFGGSTDAEGLAGALPVIALEASAGTAEISGPGVLPIERVETDDGR